MYTSLIWSLEIITVSCGIAGEHFDKGEFDIYLYSVFLYFHSNLNFVTYKLNNVISGRRGSKIHEWYCREPTCNQYVLVYYKIRLLYKLYNLHDSLKYNICRLFTPPPLSPSFRLKTCYPLTLTLFT